jgi:copper resistance protein B
MKRLITILLATTVAAPAFAQHAGHGETRNPQAGQAASSPAPTATCAPEHEAMGHCSMPAPSPSLAPAPAQTCTPEHASMGHCGVPARLTSTSADPHDGPTTGVVAAPPPPVEAPPPEALSGPTHAADTLFDPAAMARSRAALVGEHGGLETSKFLIDQLEVRIGHGREIYSWDAQFWYGGDINKLWLKTEGEGEFGSQFERVEVQALWSRAIDPWFDLQLGVRQDLHSGADRTHLVVGVLGLAPYWFEVEGAVFLSSRGEVTARAEVEYDLRLTQNMILQPRGEIDFSLQDVPELRLGSGISTAEIGARLRYEIFPGSGPAVVAPYVGVQYERAFTDTAGFRRAAAEDVGGWSFLVGVRTWF